MTRVTTHRRDRPAVVGLAVLVLVTGILSVAVDHGLHGGAIVPGAALANKVKGATTGRGTGGSPTSAAAVEAIVTDLLAPPEFRPASGLAAPAPTTTAASPPSQPTQPGEPPSSPLPFPPPQVSVPQVPAAVQPIVGLASPVSFAACQYLGLVPLAAALSGALGSPIALTDLLPYMKTLFDVCLVPGVPATETHCAVDRQLDDGTNLPAITIVLGLTLRDIVQGVPVPAPIGLQIDMLVQVERLVLGNPKPGDPPRPSEQLVAAFDCTQR